MKYAKLLAQYQQRMDPNRYISNRIPTIAELMNDYNQQEAPSVLNVQPQTLEQLINRPQSAEVQPFQIDNRSTAQRKALSDRAKEAMVTQALDNSYYNTVLNPQLRPLFSYNAHPFHINRDDYINHVTDLNSSSYRVSPLMDAHLASLAPNIPTDEQLMNMTDEQLVENFPMIAKLAQLAPQARAINSSRDYTLNAQSRELLTQLDARKDVFAVAMQRMDLISSPYYAQLDPTKLMQRNMQPVIDSLNSNTERTVNNEQLTDTGLEGLREYCEGVRQIQVMQDNLFINRINKTLHSGSDAQRNSSVTQYFDMQGNLLVADGRPAPLNSDVVKAHLRSGQSMLTVKGGKSIVFTPTVTESGVQIDHREAEMSEMRQQVQGLTPESIGFLLQGLNQADPGWMISSSAFRNMKRALTGLQKDFKQVTTDNGIDAANMSSMRDHLNLLFAASNEYLDFKQQQRGNLEGRSDREKQRIAIAKTLRDFSKTRADQLWEYNTAVDNEAKMNANAYQMHLSKVDVGHLKQMQAGINTTSDYITAHIMQAYAPLTMPGYSEPIRDLAGSINSAAITLGNYSTQKGGLSPQQQQEVKQVLCMMVGIRLLQNEQATQQIAGSGIGVPGMYETLYNTDREKFLSTISDGLNVDMNSFSIYQLAQSPNDLKTNIAAYAKQVNSSLGAKDEVSKQQSSAVIEKQNINEPQFKDLSQPKIPGQS